MGRHSKPSTSSVSAAKIAVTGAIIGSGSVALAAQAQAAPDSEWDVVARCESSGNWAINTGNGYQGGLQFSPSTWLGYGGGQFASAANLASKDQQIAIAEKVLAGQGRGAWPVCGRGLSGPTPRNLAAAPKAAPADAAPLDATPLDATPLDAVVPDPASATGATPEIAPEIVAVDVVTEDPAAPAAPAIPAAPADQAVPVDQAQPPAAAAPEIVEIDVVTAEPADPANPASDVVVTETDAVATGPSALEVMSAATGDAPVAPSMTQEVSFLREIWQAMRDQNLTADDMLAAMAPEPGQ